MACSHVDLKGLQYTDVSKRYNDLIVTYDTRHDKTEHMCNVWGTAVNQLVAERATATQKHTTPNPTAQSQTNTENSTQANSQTVNQWSVRIRQPADSGYGP
jgi:hypothetical protein